MLRRGFDGGQLEYTCSGTLLDVTGVSVVLVDGRWRRWLSCDFSGAELPLGCAFVDRRRQNAGDVSTEAVLSLVSGCYLPEAFAEPPARCSWQRPCA